MTLSDFKQMRLRSKSTEMVGIRGFLCTYLIIVRAKAPLHQKISELVNFARSHRNNSKHGAHRRITSKLAELS